jgi:hypothetical protein
LGNSFVSVADDASALYWNPAGVVRVPRHQVLFTVEHAGEMEGLQRSFAAIVLHSSLLSGAAGWSTAGLEGALRENLFSLSLSRHLVRRTLGAFISAGGTFKVAQVALHEEGLKALPGVAESVTKVTGDLGVLLSPIPNVQIGAIVRNLGQPQFDLVEGGEVTTLESEVEWGLSLRLRPEAQLHFSRAHLGHGWTESRLGLELTVGAYLGIRMGVTPSLVSTGFGVRWRGVRIEPSFQAHKELGLLSRIGLQYEFGAPRRGVGESFDAF